MKVVQLHAPTCHALNLSNHGISHRRVKPANRQRDYQRHHGQHQHECECKYRPHNSAWPTALPLGLRLDRRIRILFLGHSFSNCFTVCVEPGAAVPAAGTISTFIRERLSVSHSAACFEISSCTSNS